MEVSDDGVTWVGVTGDEYGGRVAHGASPGASPQRPVAAPASGRLVTRNETAALPDGPQDVRVRAEIPGEGDVVLWRGKRQAPRRSGPRGSLREWTLADVNASVGQRELSFTQEAPERSLTALLADTTLWGGYGLPVAATAGIDPSVALRVFETTGLAARLYSEPGRRGRRGDRASQ